MSKTYKTVIEATNPWKPFDFKEIIRYKDMFYYKIINGYKAEQRQTVLSYFWVILDPFVNIVFLTIVFGKLAKVDTGDIPYPAFSAAVMAGWVFLSNSLNGSVHSISSESNLMQKVYFPRIYIPIVPTIINFPNFLIQLSCTFCVLIYYDYFPTLQLIYLIPVILCAIVFSTAVGLLCTTFFVQFRDLPRVWSYAMRFYMYILPIAYPTNNVPEKYLWLYNLNPGVPIIQGFRAAMLGTPMPWVSLGIAFISSVALLYVGAVIFRYREPNIVDAM